MRVLRPLAVGLALLAVVGCEPATTADWQLFLDASSRCEPLRARHALRKSILGIWRTIDFDVTIEGREEGRCVVRFVAAAVDVEFPEFTLEVLAERGKSPAEIERQVAETKRNQQRLVGKDVLCAFPARRTRAYLTYWAQGVAPLARRQSCRGTLLNDS